MYREQENKLAAQTKTCIGMLTTKSNAINASPSVGIPVVSRNDIITGCPAEGSLDAKGGNTGKIQISNPIKQQIVQKIALAAVGKVVLT
jgi:hypothetical protein